MFGDTSTPIENAREVAESLGNGHLIEVERGRHGALLDLMLGWESGWDTSRGLLHGTNQELLRRVVLNAPDFPQPKLN